MQTDPQLPSSPRKANLQILEDITNRHNKLVTFKPTAVITGQIPLTRQPSKPINIPVKKYQPTCEQITPLEDLKLYSTVTKEALPPNKEYIQIVKDTLGPEYLGPTPLTSTTTDWFEQNQFTTEDSTYLSDFCQVTPDVSDPLLLNKHSANQNEVDLKFFFLKTVIN